MKLNERQLRALIEGALSEMGGRRDPETTSENAYRVITKALDRALAALETMGQNLGDLAGPAGVESLGDIDDKLSQAYEILWALKEKLPGMYG